MEVASSGLWLRLLRKWPQISSTSTTQLFHILRWPRSTPELESDLDTHPLTILRITSVPLVRYIVGQTVWRIRQDPLLLLITVPMYSLSFYAIQFAVQFIHAWFYRILKAHASTGPACTATPNRVEQGTCREILWGKQGYSAIIAVFPSNWKNPVFIIGFPYTPLALPCLACLI